MSSNWINTLDFCASQGVFDYDVPAFILDKQPRYIGKPQTNPMNLPGLAPNLKPQPEQDGFEPENKKMSLAKKITLGVVGLAAIIGSMFLFKSGKLKISSIKTLFSKIKLPKKISMPSKASITNFGKTILTYLKKPINFIKNLFKKKTTT